MSQENVEVVRRAIDAFNRRGADACGLLAGRGSGVALAMLSPPNPAPFRVEESRNL
jgi:hypothetical protein